MRGVMLAATWAVLCGFTAQGTASYYTVASCQREGTSGVRTANGETYDETALTCALRRRDFGGQYRVCTAAAPSRCVVVRHNDFGPGKGATARGVVIDLTPAAFQALSPLRAGVVAVTVEALP